MTNPLIRAMHLIITTENGKERKHQDEQINKLREDVNKNNETLLKKVNELDTRTKQNLSTIRESITEVTNTANQALQTAIDEKNVEVKEITDDLGTAQNDIELLRRHLDDLTNRTMRSNLVKIFLKTKK